MDIRNITTFICVAEMGSFTKAALSLGYSQSTISIQIKQLETEFHCQLFERINHSVTLTDKGRELLSYAHRINRLTDEMHEAMTQDHDVQGSVRIATADSLCATLMREKYISFRQRYPGITLKMVPAGTEEMFRMMNYNEVDAIMTLDSHIYNTDYIVAKEEQAHAIFVASPQLITPLISPLSIHQLLSYPFLLTEKGMSYRRILDEKLAAQSLEIHPVLEIGNTDLLADLAVQGAGIAVLPDFVANDYLRQGKLIALTVKDMELEIWKQMIYHRRKWLSKPLECVIRHFC